MLAQSGKAAEPQVTREREYSIFGLDVSGMDMVRRSIREPGVYTGSIPAMDAARRLEAQLRTPYAVRRHRAPIAAFVGRAY